MGLLGGAAYAAWTPTPSIILAKALPLAAPGDSVSAQLVLDPDDAGGNWQVDDIYIDPYRRT